MSAALTSLVSSIITDAAGYISDLQVAFALAAGVTGLVMVLRLVRGRG